MSAPVLDTVYVWSDRRLEWDDVPVPKGLDARVIAGGLRATQGKHAIAGSSAVGPPEGRPAEVAPHGNQSAADDCDRVHVWRWELNRWSTATLARNPRYRDAGSLLSAARARGYVARLGYRGDRTPAEPPTGHEMDEARYRREEKAPGLAFD